MITKRPGLLLQLPEGAFNPKTVTIQTDDGKWFQLQAGACQDALYPIHFHQDKAQLLIELLSPEQINAVVTYGFLLPIEFDLCFLELFPMGKEQFFQVDSRPLFGRPSPSRFPGTRFFICGAGLFRLVMIPMRTSPSLLRSLSLSRAGTVRKYLSSRSRESPKVRAAW